MMHPSQLCSTHARQYFDFFFLSSLRRSGVFHIVVVLRRRATLGARFTNPRVHPAFIPAPCRAAKPDVWVPASHYEATDPIHGTRRVRASVSPRYQWSKAGDVQIFHRMQRYIKDKPPIPPSYFSLCGGICHDLIHSLLYLLYHPQFKQAFFVSPDCFGVCSAL